MRGGTGIRRVIIVVLDGLRPDAINRFELIGQLIAVLTGLVIIGR